MLFRALKAPFATWVVGAAVAIAAVLPADGRAQVDSGSSDAVHRAAILSPRSGDRVAVRVYAYASPPLVADALFVDDRGFIVLPQVGPLQVSTLPINRLRDTITALYAKDSKTAYVDVTVARKITVSGSVYRPGVYYADLGAQVRDAIAVAGGVTEFGNPAHVSIGRAGHLTPVPLWATETGPATDLASGDFVDVGRRSWLELNIIPVASLALSAVTLLISLRK